MLASVDTAVLVGIEGSAVRVEVHVSSGLPGFSIVGLPDASCREARDRVRAALLSSGFDWPRTRVTVNLAPTGLRKGGAALDLPIAIALLVASEQLSVRAAEGVAFFGELGLDGSVRAVSGALSLVDAVSCDTVVVPAVNAAEAGLVSGRRVRPAGDLGGLVAALRGDAAWPAAFIAEVGSESDRDRAPDLCDVRGQAVGRTALEVAAAGGHHLLLVGPPGAGKTMLASRLPGILPSLSTSEGLEVARIHSAAGLTLPADGLIRRPPFRAPHHGASPVSLVGGGGHRLRPGEISCAHYGVLFLDELAEFHADVLDTLRQPLEEGQVLVCRARASLLFPADFLLVAAMNPCPCGSGEPAGCRCSERQRSRYGERLSGPLLDRFDLRVLVQRADPAELLGEVAEAPAGESSAVVASGVEAVRGLAAARGVKTNAAIPSSRLDELAPLDRPACKLLQARLRQGSLSARGLHRVRKVARTVADLDGRDGLVTATDVVTALSLRSNVLPGRQEAS